MPWKLKLATATAAIGLLALMSETGVRAQDYYNYNGSGYSANNNAYAPYNYGGYGYQAPPVPYANGAYVYQQPYPYYGNYYYGASPQYGYAYGGPILYGRFGRDGRIGFRYGWW